MKTTTKCQADVLSRRNFLTVAAAAPAVLGAASLARGVLADEPAASPAAAKKYPIGLELYSVRTELAHDLPKTLANVGKMGYDCVEFYAPYYGWSLPYAKEVRSMMDDLGLRCYSTHNHIESYTPGEKMAKAIELNQILGCKYLVMASAPGNTKTLDNWMLLCEQLSAATETFKSHGLSAGMHNHQSEWAPLAGERRIMDVIAANTPKEFVLQLDVGTCVEAGADPVAWIKANPGRIKVLHLKDWAPGSAKDEKGYRVLFGEGSSPWKEIIAAAQSVGGAEYYLMEQEGSRFSEFETAQRCLDAWKTFRTQG
jgi:sugar phosphate isomerase/epimerase